MSRSLYKLVRRFLRLRKRHQLQPVVARGVREVLAELLEDLVVLFDHTHLDLTVKTQVVGEGGALVQTHLWREVHGGDLAS